MNTDSPITHADLLQLKRWNTPAICNGWEQITRRDIAAEAFNIEETRDFMPQMGPMVGYAVTLVIEPSKRHAQTHRNGWADYRRYVASVPGPKIVIVQDLDKPRVIGSCMGEVNSNIHRALGCVGAIIDGAIRDVDEMSNAGFKALARRLCVSHAHYNPVRWGCDVEVFGRKVSPGDLVHADKHGFIVIAPEEQAPLLEATRFMDANECLTLIPAARETAGIGTQELLTRIDQAAAQFAQNVNDKLHRQV
jgi:regulator of RNase E activity RraA